MFTRDCPQCNNTIYYNHELSKIKADKVKTRCASCRNHRNLSSNCECKICQKPLYRRPSTLREIVFCSYGCRNRYYSGDKGKHKPKPKRDRSSDLSRLKCNKQKAVAYKGGKCEKCGYNKCIAAMDFHHINPDDKMYDVKDIMARKWETIKSEIEKCMLLCSNCHREEHWNERNKKRTILE